MSRWAHSIFAFTLTPGVFAATIINTTGQFYSGPWNGVAADRIDGDSSHFYDGPSIDSTGSQTAGCSLGYYIQGSGGGCTNQPNGIDRLSGANYNGPGAGTAGTRWLGSSPTANNLNFEFSPQGPSYTVELMAEANLFHSSTALGVYTADPAGNVTARLILFAGADTPGKRVTFTPGAATSWGFYFVTGLGSYYTDRLLGNDTGMQHFGVFKDPADVSPGLGFTRLWIGTEWSPQWLGAPDYNDMIFTLTCNECSTVVDPGELRVVPEPETFATFGTGAFLIAAAVILRRVRSHAAAWRESATLRRGPKANNLSE